MTQLQFTGSENNFVIPLKKRIVIGASESCDITISGNGIADIHALLEVSNSSYKIFSLDPKRQVEVNGSAVVTQVIGAGDLVKIGNIELRLDNIAIGNIKDLPVMPNFDKKNQGEEGYSNNYPLAKDPDAVYSEYIFEEEEIYPIFKYSVDKTVAEVLVLFNDKIISVDYVPHKDGVYSLAGVMEARKEIEFPYLGKKEKLPVIEIKGGEIFAHQIPGFHHVEHSDSGVSPSGTFLLGKDDIHIFTKDDLKIFIRGDEAPPRVKPAPILRRDKELKKYLFLCLLLVASFLAGIQLYEVDPELEKEKIPERIATILYKPKQLNITKKKTVVKKKNKKVKKQQKAPTEKKVAANEKKAVKPTKGRPTAKKKGPTKKGKPKIGKPNNLKVVKSTKKSGGKPRKTSNRPTKVKKATNAKKYKGTVDTYVMPNVASTLTNTMVKGGTLSSFKSKAGASETFSDNNSIAGGESAQVKKANVSGKVGDLSSSTDGSLASSYGTDGLVDKKQIYTAGIPKKFFVLGSIDRNDIYRILIQNIPQFRYCYQRVLDDKQQGVDGVIRVNFVIGPSGHVTKARTVSADKTLPRGVVGCVINHLKTIQFPQPKGGGEVSVNTPLNLFSKSI